MPNWVDITMTVEGPESALQEFKKEIAGDGVFDFNALIPMPEELAIEESTLAKNAYTAYYGSASEQEKLLSERAHAKKFNSIEDYREWGCTTHPGFRELADKVHYNLTNYGARSWYDWCVQNWGTKWNACEATLAEESATCLSYFFQTAWSLPVPVLEQLAKKYPGLKINGSFDEEGGYFYGEFSTRDGILLLGSHEGYRDAVDEDDY